MGNHLGTLCRMELVNGTSHDLVFECADLPEGKLQLHHKTRTTVTYKTQDVAVKVLCGDGEQAAEVLQFTAQERVLVVDERGGTISLGCWDQRRADAIPHMQRIIAFHQKNMDWHSRTQTQCSGSDVSWTAGGAPGAGGAKGAFATGQGLVGTAKAPGEELTAARGPPEVAGGGGPTRLKPGVHMGIAAGVGAATAAVTVGASAAVADLGEQKARRRQAAHGQSCTLWPDTFLIERGHLRGHTLQSLAERRVELARLVEDVVFQFLGEHEVSYLQVAKAAGIGALQGVALGTVAGSAGAGIAHSVAKLMAPASLGFVAAGGLFAVECASAMWKVYHGAIRRQAGHRLAIKATAGLAMNSAVCGLAFVPVLGLPLAIVGGLVWNLADEACSITGQLAEKLLPISPEEDDFQRELQYGEVIDAAMAAFNFPGQTVQQLEAQRPGALRARYRQIMRQIHPDRNSGRLHPHNHTITTAFLLLMVEYDHNGAQTDEVDFQGYLQIAAAAHE